MEFFCITLKKNSFFQFPFLSLSFFLGARCSLAPAPLPNTTKKNLPLQLLRRVVAPPPALRGLERCLCGGPPRLPHRALRRPRPPGGRLPGRRRERARQGAAQVLEAQVGVGRGPDDGVGQGCCRCGFGCRRRRSRRRRCRSPSFFSLVFPSSSSPSLSLSLCRSTASSYTAAAALLICPASSGIGGEAPRSILAFSSGEEKKRSALFKATTCGLER